MQNTDHTGKCKCQGKCQHEYQKRLKKGSSRTVNCQDGFMYYDATADCMIYKCGKTKHSLVDHTKFKKDEKEFLEEHGLIEYINKTKWAVVENKKGNCGWQEVVPAHTNKVIVARTTVRKSGKVKLRVNVHPSLGTKLTLEQRQLIGKNDMKKTSVAKRVIEETKQREHLRRQLEWHKWTHHL